MVCSMGAVLHFRICKGCLIKHKHSHSHTAISQHYGSDDDLVAVSSNGYQPLLTEARSDAQLLVNSECDDDRQPPEYTGQRENRATNVNIRAAMVHVIGDLIQSLGVLTAAIIVLVKVSYCR